MKQRIFTLLKFLIGWPFSLIALFFIGKLIAPQFPTLLSHLHEISVPLLIYGVYCFLLFYFLRCYVWKRLLQERGHPISLKESCFLWASSELKRYIPGNIWSFLGRTLLFSERGVPKKEIGKALIIEAELLVVSAAVVSLLSLPFLSHFALIPNWVVTFSPWIILAGILLYIFHGKMKIKHFIFPTYRPAEILFLIFLMAIGFVFFGLGHYFIIASFIALTPDLIWKLTGFSVLVFLLGYLSLLTPAGFGVREGAMIFGLLKIMPSGAAAFVALFSRAILILSEVFFVLLTFLWHKTKNKTVEDLEKWIREHKHITILLLLSVIYVVYFATVSFLRYDNFYAGRFDLGNMAQTVWNTTRGRIFMFTDPNGTEIMSRLSTHADFILVLLAPLYALWPDPRNLLLIQTIVLAAGSFFVYLLAKEVLKNKHLALVFGFIYLINPGIERTNLYDFHAVTLATTFLLATFYFFIKKRYVLFLVFAILAGLCKEQIWLTVGLFGPFLFFWHKKRIFGTIVFIVSILFSYYLISYAIPQALGSQHFALAYYSDFGDSPIKIIESILLSPQKTFSILLLHDRIDYLKQLFVPLGYLSVFTPWFLIFAAPDLVIDLLSNNPHLHQIYYQYSATITPFLFIAAIYAVLIIKKIAMKQLNNETIRSWINITMIVYLLIMALHAAYQYGPLPGSKDSNLDMITKPVADRAFIDTYLTGIKKRYSVAASNNIGSHLSQRQQIYILPLGIDKADIIVFLLNDAEDPQSLLSEREQVTKLRLDPRYTLTVDRDGFVVFVRK